MQRILLLCVFVVCVLLCACGTQEVSLSKGRFSFPVAHNFIGAAKELPQKTSINNMIVSLAYVPEESSLRMNDVKNDGKSVDFVYSLNRLPVMVSYTHLNKKRSFLLGFGLGCGRYFYGRFIAGGNKKHIEWGGYFDLGFGFDSGSYEYSYYESSGFFSTVGEGYIHRGDSTYSDESIFHFVWTLGGYVSYYHGAFGVTYAPSLYAPWNRFNLPVYAMNDGDYDYSFWFPEVLSQYVGISFWLTDHWKISGGATFLTPIYFNSIVVLANTSISFWF